MVGALALVKDNWHVLCTEAIIREVSIFMGRKAFDYLEGLHTPSPKEFSLHHNGGYMMLNALGAKW